MNWFKFCQLPRESPLEGGKNRDWLVVDPKQVKTLQATLKLLGAVVDTPEDGNDGCRFKARHRMCNNESHCHIGGVASTSARCRVVMADAYDEGYFLYNPSRLTKMTAPQRDSDELG